MNLVVSRLLPVAVPNTMDQKQLGKGGIYLVYTSKSQSTTEGS